MQQKPASLSSVFGEESTITHTPDDSRLKDEEFVKLDRLEREAMDAKPKSPGAEDIQSESESDTSVSSQLSSRTTLRNRLRKKGKIEDLHVATSKLPESGQFTR